MKTCEEAGGFIFLNPGRYIFVSTILIFITVQLPFYRVGFKKSLWAYLDAIMGNTNNASNPHLCAMQLLYNILLLLQHTLISHPSAIVIIFLTDFLDNDNACWWHRWRYRGKDLVEIFDITGVSGSCFSTKAALKNNIGRCDLKMVLQCMKG